VTVVNSNKSWLIPVPAAAVIQERLAVFLVVGRKGYVGRFFKALNSFKCVHLKHQC
jgi:hypothetical protein